MKAVAELHSCIQTRCCPVDDTVNSLTYDWWNQTILAGNCSITNERYGLTEIDYNDHDGEDRLVSTFLRRVGAVELRIVNKKIKGPDSSYF